MNLIMNENIYYFKDRFSLIPIQRVCTNVLMFIHKVCKKKNL